MTLSGIYAIEVFLNHTAIGQGVAVVTEQTFYGVDDLYFCKGTYAWAEDEHIHATVEITSHTNTSRSMRGRRVAFRLDLRGTLQEKENVARFSAQMTTDLSRTILITLRKVGGLIQPGSPSWQ